VFPPIFDQIRTKRLAMPPTNLGARTLTHLLGEGYLCATQATIRDREENPSFLKILPMWGVKTLFVQKPLGMEFVCKAESDFA
jgi:hypothetical protein